MEEIDLREYLNILKNKAWIIILLTLLMVISSGIISRFVIEPEYQTFTTLMLVKPQSVESSINSSDISLNQKLVNSYGEIAKSKIVLNEVIKNLGLNISYGSLKKKITVKLIQDTEIIKIEIIDKNPEFAAKISNEISYVLIKYIGNIMKMENILVVDMAEVPSNPISPNIIFNMTIAGVLGIMIGVFLIFLVEYLNNTLKTQSDVENYLGLPVIGMIPKHNQDSKIRKNKGAGMK